MDDNLNQIISDRILPLSVNISGVDKNEDHAWKMSFVYEILY
jgi:hypothetical protein